MNEPRPMCEEEWASLLGEQPSAPVKKKNNDIKLIDCRHEPIIREEGRGTAKARFFVTDDGIGGIYGFWCPRSIIVEVKEKSLYLVPNCNIRLKVIEYVR